MTRLGINIDHVATLRNARGGVHPDPLRAARLAAEAGADGLTIHLREDRRHIRDEDVTALAGEAMLPLNLEIAATQEMQAMALQVRPHAVCLVPEKREELTTEGGLDVAGQQQRLAAFIAPLVEAGMTVSLFIDPDERQVQAAAAVGAQAIELHTGSYCDARAENRTPFYQAIEQEAKHAVTLGMDCHAGHGLDYDTAPMIAAIPQISELNIGHFLIAEAVFSGLKPAITRMKQLIECV